MSKKNKNFEEISPRARFHGAFAGFALGDAYGHPCRDLTTAEICRRFEKQGCMELPIKREENAAVFTDATQLMLFTSDGLVWADEAGSEGRSVNYASYVFLSYQYWIYTQTKKVANAKYENLFNNIPGVRMSDLIKVKGLYKNRRRDDTILQLFLNMPYMSYGRVNRNSAVNKSFSALKDGAAVARVLPAGLYFSYDPKTAFRAGADFAAITHTHPDGYLSAGVYAAVIAEIIGGKNLTDAITSSLSFLQEYEDGGNLFEKVKQAVYLAKESKTKPLESMELIGSTDNGAEVVSNALFAALVHGYTDFKNTVRLASNYSGPSEITAALAGGIVGAMHGGKSLPESWKVRLQLRQLISDCAESLYNVSAVTAEE